MSASIWAADAFPVVNAANAIARQEFEILIPGIDSVTLTTFSYVPGNSSIELFINGLRQRSGIDFEESSNITVSLIADTFSVGDIVTVVGQLSLDTVAAETVMQSLADQAGASYVGFLQAETGAVARTVEDKERERPHPDDYSTFANYVAATGPGKGLWTDGVAVVPGETENGRFHYLRDRVLIGDAANYNGIHWNGTIPATVQPDGTLDGKVAGCSFLTNRFKGAFQYLETRGQMVVESSRGWPAIVGATQTSDATENTAAIGVASIAIRNKSTGVQGCWAYYGVAIRDANTPTGIGASCAEFHVSNMINDSPQYDGYMTSAPNGYTSVLHLAQGGEHTQASQGNLTDYDVSAALVITRFKGVDGGAFLKGIVFHSQSLAGCNAGGTPGGIGIAMDMARGHQIQWRFAQGDAGVSSVIRCDGTGHYNQPRLIMSSSAFAIKQLDTSEVEQPAFQVLLPTLGAGDGVNGVFINCQKSGAGFVGISAFGVDTNLDLFLSAKGTGTIKTGYATTVAITPASFSASRRLAIKDSSGTTYYVPCSSTAW